MNDISSTIASGIDQQLDAAREIAGNVHEAARGTSEVSQSIAGVGNAADETGTAATGVLESSNQLSRSACELRLAIDRFLAGIRAA